MYAVFFFLFAIMTLPIRLDAYGAFGKGYEPGGYVRARAYHVGIRLDWHLIRQDGQYSITLRFVRKKKSKGRDVKNVGLVIVEQYRILHSSRMLMNALNGLSKGLRLHANMRIGTGDAASTALVCAAVQVLSGAVRGLRAQIIPEYAAHALTGEIRCIAFFRAGRIIIAAMLYLYAKSLKLAEKEAGGKQNGKNAHQLRHADGA